MNVNCFCKIFFCLICTSTLASAKNSIQPSLSLRKVLCSFFVKPQRSLEQYLTKWIFRRKLFFANLRKEYAIGGPVKNSFARLIRKGAVFSPSGKVVFKRFFPNVLEKKKHLARVHLRHLCSLSPDLLQRIEFASLEHIHLNKKVIPSYLRYYLFLESSRESFYCREISSPALMKWFTCHRNDFVAFLFHSFFMHSYVLKNRLIQRLKNSSYFYRCLKRYSSQVLQRMNKEIFICLGRCGMLTKFLQALTFVQTKALPPAIRLLYLKYFVFKKRHIEFLSLY